MSLVLDTSPIDRVIVGLKGMESQMPFALMRSMNEAKKVTQTGLSEETWPTQIGNVRNRAFPKYALSMSKNATKKNLRIEINDERLQADGKNIRLGQFEKGGTRRPLKNAALAVPSKQIQGRRGSRGVPKNLRPKALPNTFRRGDVIFQRVGRYTKGRRGGKGKDGRGLKLVYVLKPQVRIPPRVHFKADFDRMMRAEFKRQFPIQIRKAIQTAMRKK